MSTELASTLPQTRMTTSMPSFLEELLAEQQDLTAVERFSQFHENVQQPLQARYYSTLLPASPPGPGEQYAFEVDLDRCSGCKACVTACHSLNGLDEDETWRDVGMLHGGSVTLPVLQHVTTACHHCLDPACLNVCPTRAYEKDSVTGIVKHLDDQCFGCQYCILACPYEVPKYSPKRGIVRKCDMCSQRLAVGEAPACVQSCPHEAIRIAVVKKADVAADCEANPFLPGAPDPQYTQPTTNYKSSRPFPRNMLPADYHAVQAEHAHVPLIVMLVLTQLSVGAFLIGQILQWNLQGTDVLSKVLPLQTASALIFGLLALGASTLHLGRPWLAFRAILGLRNSWLSREIVAFGAFAKLAALYAGVLWLWPDAEPAWTSALGAGVVLAGTAGVFCSIMIYHCTQRPFWSGASTFSKFTLTTLWLGVASVLTASVLAAILEQSLTVREMMSAFGTRLCHAMILVAAIKLLHEASLFAHLSSKQTTPLNRSARLMFGELSVWTRYRWGCGLLGGIVLPLALLNQLTSESSTLTGAGIAGFCIAAFVLSAGGELLERTLFFKAAVAPRMPGRLRT
jgi:Fe-S-cluster-containing dehydrogenase component/DMSO reductase anchor subunit